jgi:hypothetical protein
LVNAAGVLIHHVAPAPLICPVAFILDEWRSPMVNRRFAKRRQMPLDGNPTPSQSAFITARDRRKQRCKGPGISPVPA